MSTAPEEPSTDLVPFESSPEDYVGVMRVGAKDHQIKVVKQCNTCASAYREQIEMWALEGRRLPWIADQLLSLAHGRQDLVPDYQSLRRHYLNRHSTAAAYFNQRLIEKTAETLHKKIDEAADEQIEVLTLAAKVVDIRSRLFLTEEDKPSDAILTKSMDILLDQDSKAKTGSLDADAFMHVIDIILAIANEHAVDRTEFGEALMANPVLMKFDRVMRGLPAEAAGPEDL